MKTTTKRLVFAGSAVLIATACAKKQSPWFQPPSVPSWVQQQAPLQETPVGKTDYSSKDGLFTAKKRQFGEYEINIISNVPEPADAKKLFTENGTLYYAEFQGAVNNVTVDYVKSKKSTTSWKVVISGMLRNEGLKALVFGMENEGTIDFSGFERLVEALSGKKPTSFMVSKSNYSKKSYEGLSIDSNVMAAYFFPQDEKGPIGNGEWGRIAMGITVDAVSQKIECGIVLVPENIEALEARLGRSLKISKSKVPLEKLVANSPYQQVNSSRQSSIDIPGLGRFIYDGKQVTVLRQGNYDVIDAGSFRHSIVRMAVEKTDGGVAVIIVPGDKDPGNEGQAVFIAGIKKGKIFGSEYFLKTEERQTPLGGGLGWLERAFIKYDRDLESMRVIGEDLNEQQRKEMLEASEKAGMSKDAIEAVKKEWGIE
ncbi:hypothetical protein JXA56_05190 [Candidatus Micrarchaeota archaeon]|nr:hypothetical protein [Candidatus Micrarchaeota archaeon]